MRSLRETIEVLYRRAEPTMTADDLNKLAGSTYFAQSYADKMATVCEGIACLVNSDDGARTGALQDNDSVFDMMCAVTNSFDEIAALIRLGEEVTARAEVLARSQAAAEQPPQSKAKPTQAVRADVAELVNALHFGQERFVRMMEMCKAIQNAETLEQAQALAEFGEETCGMAGDYLADVISSHEQRVAAPAKRLSAAA